jgi:hypothetical protein
LNWFSGKFLSKRLPKGKGNVSILLNFSVEDSVYLSKLFKDFVEDRLDSLNLDLEVSVTLRFISFNILYTYKTNKRVDPMLYSRTSGKQPFETNIRQLDFDGQNGKF